MGLMGKILVDASGSKVIGLTAKSGYTIGKNIGEKFKKNHKLKPSEVRKAAEKAAKHFDNKYNTKSFARKAIDPNLMGPMPTKELEDLRLETFKGVQEQMNFADGYKHNYIQGPLTQEQELYIKENSLSFVGPLPQGGASQHFIDSLDDYYDNAIENAGLTKSNFSGFVQDHPLTSIAVASGIVYGGHQIFHDDDEYDE